MKEETKNNTDIEQIVQNKIIMQHIMYMLSGSFFASIFSYSIYLLIFSPTHWVQIAYGVSFALLLAILVFFVLLSVTWVYLYKSKNKLSKYNIIWYLIICLFFMFIIASLTTYSFFEPYIHRDLVMLIWLLSTLLLLILSIVLYLIINKKYKNIKSEFESKDLLKIENDFLLSKLNLSIVVIISYILFVFYILYLFDDYYGFEWVVFIWSIPVFAIIYFMLAFSHTRIVYYLKIIFVVVSILLILLWILANFYYII